MNHARTQATLLAVEHALPVNDYWLDDVQIWPLVRRALWMHLLALPAGSEWTVPQDLATAGAPLPRQAPPRIWTNVDREQLQRCREELKPQLGRADVLVWSRTEDHTEHFTEGVLDRIADPIVLDLRALGLTTLKASRTFPADAAFRQVVPGIELRLEALARHRVRHPPTGTAEALLAGIKVLVPDFDLSHSQLVSEVRRLNYCADVFSVVLDLVKPKMVFLGVYYSPDALALIHACRRAGVVVLDVQHGKQGVHHGMYGGWSVAPVAGYSCLPDYFWTWGDSSAATINASLPRGHARPHAVVGGNRWLARWQGKADRLTPRPELAALLERIDGASRAVLISLQPLAEPLPRVLLELMALAPRDWLWVFKAHPQRASAIPDLAARIAAAGIENFEIEVASRAPLYPLLDHVSAHVTCWSSVAFEALCFGKPSLLLDPTALKLYGDYVAAGYFLYADAAADALARLQAALASPPHQPLPPYIETSTRTALRTLAGLAGRPIRRLQPRILGWLAIWWKIQRARFARRQETEGVAHATHDH